MGTLPERLRYIADQIGGVPALAEIAEVSRKTIYSWIAGRPCPARRLARIVDQLDIDASWLLKGVGEAPRGLRRVVEELARARVADAKPLGIRRMILRDAAALDRLTILSAYVQAAIEQAETDTKTREKLAASLPEYLLMAYRTGVAIPGPTHWTVLKKLIHLETPEIP